jgi:hypothetical protein
MRDLGRLRQTFYIGPSNFSVFIQIRFLSLPFYIGALQLFCIYKMPSELLFFYNLVLIFISHNITWGYQLVSFAIVPWYFRWLVLHDMQYFCSTYFNTSSYLPCFSGPIAFSNIISFRPPTPKQNNNLYLLLCFLIQDILDRPLSRSYLS